MSKRIIHPLILFLIALLAACNTVSPITSTPQGDPLAPTQEVSSLIQATPTLQGNPLALTPEIFNPLDPSPTPSNSDLPKNCQIADLNVQIDRASGYCFAYPTRFAFGKQPMFDLQAVIGPEIGDGADPVSAIFAVESTAYNPDQSLDQQVDAYLQGFTTAAPSSLVHTQLAVDGEAAVMVDNIPVQLSWRIVFVPHQGRLYRLMYWPVDLKEAQADLDELYQTTLNSFVFISGAGTAREGQEPTVTMSINGVAQGFVSEVVAAVQPGAETAWWDPAPQFTRLSLQGYPVVNFSRQPQIFIYPVSELGMSNENASKVIASLQALIQSPQEIATLPFLPLTGDVQMMHAHLQYLDFKNGQGLRYLVQYGNGLSPINNAGLLYTYQGITRDGKFYVAAILPVNHPSLPDDATVTGKEPSEFRSNYPQYRANVAGALNIQAANTFSPDLTQLDTMLSSLEIK